MNRKSNNPQNGKLTSAHRIAVRAMLATGATLAMLISAQGFANNAAQTATTTAAVQSSTASVTSTTSTTSTDENESGIVLVTSNQPTTYSIFSTVSQPNPGTRSSR